MTFTTLLDGLGGVDTIYGNDGEDVLVGGAWNDNVDGGTGRDLIFGDNVSLNRVVGDFTSARFVNLTGSTLYDPVTLLPAINPAAQN